MPVIHEEEGSNGAEPVWGGEVWLRITLSSFKDTMAVMDGAATAFYERLCFCTRLCLGSIIFGIWFWRHWTHGRYHGVSEFNLTQSPASKLRPIQCSPGIRAQLQFPACQEYHLPSGNENPDAFIV
ncbi:hypothetical protein K440DRAFT_580303 [Wilcoxina mikolae CBS 423.85]|nr:hypothetical protein K440DRAFT_580303 [Wilcoxina mikolae CBS 423.85]